MNENFSLKPHIVINKSRSKYVLLDENLLEVDSQTQASLFTLFTRGHKLRKFRSQLRKDLRAYKKECKLLKTKPDKDFLKMHKDIMFYLSICPDADYNILELIRRNIVHLNPKYHNYQAACAEYLRELARLTDGNPNLMPFDINFATEDNHLSTKHKYISNSFVSFFGGFVDDFRDICKTPDDERTSFLKSYAYEPFKPVYNSKYYAQKYVYTPEQTNEDR